MSTKTLQEFKLAFSTKKKDNHVTFYLEKEEKTTDSTDE